MDQVRFSGSDEFAQSMRIIGRGEVSCFPYGGQENGGEKFFRSVLTIGQVTGVTVGGQAFDGFQKVNFRASFSC